MSDLNELSTVCRSIKYIHMYPWDCYTENVIILFTVLRLMWMESITVILLFITEGIWNVDQPYLTCVKQITKPLCIQTIWRSRTFFKELGGLPCHFFHLKKLNLIRSILLIQCRYRLQVHTVCGGPRMEIAVMKKEVGGGRPWNTLTYFRVQDW